MKVEVEMRVVQFWADFCCGRLVVAYDIPFCGEEELFAMGVDVFLGRWVGDLKKHHSIDTGGNYGWKYLSS